MCVVSMIYDHYRDRWSQPPYWIPAQPQIPLEPIDLEKFFNKPKPITDDEINEFRQLLERAREYDKRNNEPECEMESKKQQLRDLAQKLNIDISFIEAEK